MKVEKYVELLHTANMRARASLTYKENNLLEKYLRFEEELLEAQRTPGLTDKDRKRIELEAFNSVPGSKDAYDKWLTALQNEKLAIFAEYN